ncbi:hypothetical protein CENSYa_0035 [Cenarchaeum symbiosum A]|uniref:Uncharacterized protein n=1 Tax=Cenarchaeum symbiosum (strain A) TaxID=414004 RepID=A0RTM5_CENSY|nr:hypothetical protein CENSYa_0035 [Cenarchaeum symbiosum A]
MLSGRSRQEPAGRIRMLKMEADILAKSIARLHQHDTGLSPEKEDRLIARYRAQLRTASGEIERLEDSMQFDIGSLKDGLAKIVESRFTALDEKLHELSSKMDAMAAERRRPEPTVQSSPDVRPADRDVRRPDPIARPDTGTRPEAPTVDITQGAVGTESGQTNSDAAQDESEDDIDELRKRIMNTLKKLDQAEVE